MTAIKTKPQRGIEVNVKVKTESSQKEAKIVWISSDEDDGGGQEDGGDNNSDDDSLTRKLQSMSVNGADSQRCALQASPSKSATSSTLEFSPAPASTPPLAETPAMAPNPAPAPTPAPTAAPATPGRQGKFNAYVVYSGKCPYYYEKWARVKALKEADASLVFKGFKSLDQAKQAWCAARDSGVIKAISNGAGRTYWTVTEGVRPAVYHSLLVVCYVFILVLYSQASRHDALREGLEWGAGHLKGFVNEDDASEDWAEKSNANPSRIFERPSPGFF
ncbi:hypothetical protein FB446DRAFT_794713 [Lentinula raphanica]|nr:hypothetical protein FB446DRAFT_794713 [Lentinula raphanica]